MSRILAFIWFLNGITKEQKKSGSLAGAKGAGAGFAFFFAQMLRNPLFSLHYSAIFMDSAFQVQLLAFLCV